MHDPEDQWAAEQRVRYLAESGRFDSAYAAAKECKAGGWWCDVLEGFSLHLLGRYAASDSVYNHALGQMLPRERCDWRNIDMLIDDDTRQQYQRYTCGDPRREAFENRVWFFARTLYSLDGNDSRTEHYARKTMEMMLRDAPGVTVTDSQEDDLELMLRFGWPRAWGVSTISGQRSDGFSMGMPRRYPGGGQFLRLFAAASKHVRIAAFEADNGMAGARFLDQQLVQFLLGDGVLARAFAGVNKFGGGRGQAKQIAIDQRIVNHHAGPGQQFSAAQSQQPGVPGSCADQINSPCGFTSHGDRGRCWSKR